MKRWRKKAASCVLVLMILASGASVLAAVQGTQENPLITLTYLKSIFKPELLKETDKKLADSKASYEKKLDDKITAYKQELGGTGGGSSAGAEFRVVDLAAGQLLYPALGCELMLRVGEAQFLSTESLGLIDATSGAVLEGGGALEKNHLYLASLATHSVKAQGEVKLLVRGGYTIS